VVDLLTAKNLAAMLEALGYVCEARPCQTLAAELRRLAAGAGTVEVLICALASGA
jgi:hypothetical protein